MRKYLYLPLIAVSALVAAPTAAEASAHAPVTHVLTIKSTGGTAVKVGAKLKASLVTGTSAVFSITGVMVSCKSASFAAIVKTNPTTPGTARESLTSLSFAKCTVPVAHVRVLSVLAKNLPYVARVSDSTGDPVKIKGHSRTAPLRFTAKIEFGTTRFACSYKATSVSGTASNTGNQVSFVSQKFTKVTGGRLCPRSAMFSAAFGPIKDVSVTGNPLVFVN
jgi:hypothetical protein